MNKKKILTIALITIVLALATGTYIYLSHAEEDLEPFQETTAEPFQKESNDTSRFRYLKEYLLKIEGQSLKVYLPENAKSSENENKASGDTNGVSVTAEFILNDDTDTETLTVQETENQMTGISTFEGVQDISLKEVVSAKNYSIQQIDYSINDGNGTLYPCIVIIKTDEIETGTYLRSVIKIDNTAATEKTSSCLKEIIKAYGISLD